MLDEERATMSNGRSRIQRILRNSTANSAIHNQLDHLGLNLCCTLYKGHDHQEFTQPFSLSFIHNVRRGLTPSQGSCVEEIHRSNVEAFRAVHLTQTRNHLAYFLLPRRILDLLRP